MQFRELSATEHTEGFALLSTLRAELTLDQFEAFLASHYPKDYRPIGAYERGKLRIYAGVSIRENLELGRHLIVDDFTALEGYYHLSAEMIDYLADYAKMYQCQSILLWGKQRGISIDDLSGFRPKRDGYIKTV